MTPRIRFEKSRAWDAEARSKVAFDIEDVGHGVVRLTVTHGGFTPGRAVLPAISEGWPAASKELPAWPGRSGVGQAASALRAAVSPHRRL
jgi:hypothetical protein